MVAPARAVPGGAITVDRDAAFAGIHPLGRAVAGRIHEHDRITRLHVDLLRTGHAVHRAALAFHPFLSALRVEELRVDEIGLVRTGDDHGRAIARPDVGMGDQHVDLRTVETAVVVAELHALAAVVPAGVQRDRLAGPADREEVLVDEQRPVVVIKRFLPADEPQHVVDVVRVVDHPLKRPAQLVHLLVADAAVLGMVLPLHPAMPAGPRQRTRDGVDAGVAVGDLLLRERAADDDKAVQVKKVLVELARDLRVGPLDLGGLGVVVVKALVHGATIIELFRNFFPFTPNILLLSNLDAPYRRPPCRHPA